jgi:hypothetical protein
MIAVAGLGAIAAPSMAADFRVATTTTLVASPTAVDSSASVTLTANVLPGFLVGPLGNVKFTDSTNGAVLGTIKPKLDCILRRAPCVATLTVTASTLAPGNNAVVANYSGGLFTKPSSSAPTDVFVGKTNTCQPGTGQCNTTTSSSDGLSSATISTTPGTQAETVQAAFDTETPPSLCTTVGGGETLVYSVTNAPVEGTKTISLTLTGTAADEEHGVDPNNLGNVCFGSTSSFETASGGMATLNAADGLYYGNLPLCDDNDNDLGSDSEETGKAVVTSPPCINPVDPTADTWATYTQGTTSTYKESFTTTASDPKAHG